MCTIFFTLGCLPGFLKPETVTELWKVAANTEGQGHKDGGYALGWVVIPEKQDFGACHHQSETILHGGTKIMGGLCDTNLLKNLSNRTMKKKEKYMLCRFPEHKLSTRPKLKSSIRFLFSVFFFWGGGGFKVKVKKRNSACKKVTSDQLLMFA